MDTPWFSAKDLVFKYHGDSCHIKKYSYLEVFFFFFQNDLLKNDLRDYQRQMESQRESLLQKRGDDVEYQDKLRQKNRDLNEQLEEIQVP